MRGTRRPRSRRIPPLVFASSSQEARVDLTGSGASLRGYSWASGNKKLVVEPCFSSFYFVLFLGLFFFESNRLPLSVLGALVFGSSTPSNAWPTLTVSSRAHAC